MIVSVFRGFVKCYNQSNMSKIVKLTADTYRFNTNDNPYAFDFKELKGLEDIAESLDETILERFNGRNILLRMIQSGKHADKISRKELIDYILETGSDYHQDESTNASQAPDAEIDIYAARFNPFDKGTSTLKLFESFHKWKPKCEERPQYPVDIILVYDYDSYGNIKYKHPRYGVEADDAYKLKNGKSRTDSLLGVFVIN